jgi:hypothetical protein
MRTVLIGSDFTYNSLGKLVPIEINTNVGFDTIIPETNDEIFDMSLLKTFILDNIFKKLIYIGSLRYMSDIFKTVCDELNIEYDFMYVRAGSVSIPEIDDLPDQLIIRSSYDNSAIVDEKYCKNKINFLNLIKNEFYGAEFAYMDENGRIVSNITTFEDYGNHPNYILKAVFPHYDHTQYPKLYRIRNQAELEIVLSNVNSSYFLMKYHYNRDKRFQDNIYVIRHLSIFYPPLLKSISIGSYTRLSTRAIDELSVFDDNTLELDWYDRSKYITSDTNVLQPKLLDGDMVELADGTFKRAIDIQIGDILKTIKIYNPYNVDLSTDVTKYHISFDEFKNNSSYTTNTVIDKIRVDKYTDYVNIKFTDGTEWSDTENSSYLVERGGEIMFAYLRVVANALTIGDKIILVDTSYSSFTPVSKIVETISYSRQIFSGWEIFIDGEHIFLTKTEGEESQSFAAIEHNPTCAATFPPACNGTGCTKNFPCADCGGGTCDCGCEPV